MAASHELFEFDVQVRCSMLDAVRARARACACACEVVFLNVSVEAVDGVPVGFWCRCRFVLCCVGGAWEVVVVVSCRSTHFESDRKI